MSEFRIFGRGPKGQDKSKKGPDSSGHNLEFSEADKQRLEQIRSRQQEIKAIVTNPVELNKLNLDQITALQQENMGLFKEQKALEAKERGFTPVDELIKNSSQELADALNVRFQELGSKLNFEFSSPQSPENLTLEHLEALKTIFGPDNLKLMPVPTLEELNVLDENYAQVMYPETQTDQDKKRGLISFRPDWLKDKTDKGKKANLAEFEGCDFKDENWREAYLRNMREELQQLSNSVILVESIQKPKYIDGTQQYGSQEGNQSGQDSLLSVIQEVFGSEVNRFNHSWDDLQTLIPKVKEKITKLFQDQGLSIPDFEVQLCPASVFNLEITLFNPQNSITNTWEWTSTVIKDRNDKDSGRRLSVGGSGYGGASDVEGGHRDYSYGGRGFRLAVVFKAKS